MIFGRRTEQSELLQSTSQSYLACVHVCFSRHAMLLSEGVLPQVSKIRVLFRAMPFPMVSNDNWVKPWTKLGCA